MPPTSLLPEHPPRPLGETVLNSLRAGGGVSQSRENVHEILASRAFLTRCSRGISRAPISSGEPGILVLCQPSRIVGDQDFLHLAESPRTRSRRVLA